MKEQAAKRMRARRRLAVAAMAAVLLSIAGSVAAQDIDPVPAISAALESKQPAAAETLARAALAAEDAAHGADNLLGANLARLLGDALYDQQRYAEAEPHYRRAYTVRLAQLGATNADTGVSANDLAIVLRALKRYPEAEAKYREALSIRRAALGDTDTRTARTAYFLARSIDDQGRAGDAASAMDLALALARQSYGPEDPTTIGWMIDRAGMLHDAGDPRAEAAYREAIALGERILTAGDMALASARQGLGNWLLAADRAAEAIPLYRAALVARETGFGPTDPATMRSAERLARALWADDQMAEAETLFRQVLAFREATDGPTSAGVADMLRWIGRAEDARGALADAEITFKRALSISEQLAPRDLLTGFDLMALGQLYSSQRRFAEARPLLTRAVALLSAPGTDAAIAASARLALSMLAFESGRSDEAMATALAALADFRSIDDGRSVDVASVLTTLAGYAHEMGDFDAAARYALDGIARFEAVAPTSRERLRAVSLLGRIRQDQGQLAEAESLHRQVLDTLVARYGAQDIEVEPALADLGAVRLARGDVAGGVTLLEQAVALVDAAAARDAASMFATRTGDVEDQVAARAGLYDRLIGAHYRLAEVDPSRAAETAARSFVLAQQVALTRAARALADLATREAAGSSELAALVRDRQDLLAQWRRQDAQLSVLRAGGAPDPRAIAGLTATLGSTDAAIAALDARLAQDFPGFARLQRPTPLAPTTAAHQLGQNDVLLFFADTAAKGAVAERFVWALLPDGTLSFQRLPRSGRDIAAKVRSLRDALGVAGSSRGPTAVVRSTGKDRTSRILAAATDLYDATLRPLDRLIAGRNLLVVPSRSLSALPFQLLVTAPPPSTGDRFADAAWLVRTHAIDVLPAVSALATPPRAAAPQAAGYLAFANPLLSGRGGTDRRAFSRTTCDTAPAARQAALRLPAPSRLFRGASGDVAAVRALPPLPETVDEVCAIADLLGASGDALQLASDASEAQVQALSAGGQLGAARIVHFATHGLVSGDLDGLAEPALVLSPPDKTGGGDDGLLTASEIAALRLSADWVILSACNTASSDGSGEQLSGLARAFFYAGARALLVSHWPVNSQAAVALATGAVAALVTRPELGKAEALRRAMLAELAKGGSHADPVNWAPFVVVSGSAGD